ncbi:MAG: hypothetical protein WCF12_04740 [Propionicimonas sp.]
MDGKGITMELGRRNAIAQRPPVLPDFSPYASPTLPLPPPRSEDELVALVELVACLPTSERGWVREALATVSDDAAAIELATTMVAQRPMREVGFTMMLLAIVGELRDDRSLDVLRDLIWTDDEALWGVAFDKASGDGCLFESAGMVQARAAEMFAWIAATRFDDELLRVVAEHPTKTTRLAAADALLYHHGDRPDALEQVLAAARVDDHDWIGVPRYVRTNDPASFDESLRLDEGDVELPRTTDARSSDV